MIPARSRDAALVHANGERGERSKKLDRSPTFVRYSSTVPAVTLQKIDRYSTLSSAAITKNRVIQQHYDIYRCYYYCIVFSRLGDILLEKRNSTSSITRATGNDDDNDGHWRCLVGFRQIGGGRSYHDEKSIVTSNLYRNETTSAYREIAKRGRMETI